MGLTGLFYSQHPRDARQGARSEKDDRRVRLRHPPRDRRRRAISASRGAVRLHAIDATRVHQTTVRTASSDRCSAQVSGANIKEVAEAGVDMFVAGSAIFRDPRTEEAYKKTIDAMRDELAAAKVPANKVAA